MSTQTGNLMAYPREEEKKAAPLPSSPVPWYDIEVVRREFPILRRKVYGKQLVYLDSAATTQTPLVVVEAISEFMSSWNANVHRGVQHLSARASEAYENARMTMQGFLGAEHPEEIIFVRGTTEGINLVAQTFGRTHVGEGDEVLITAMEHHSNIVPWQRLCAEKRARLRVAPITDGGELKLEDLDGLVGPRTRLVAVTHVSNVLGTINPIERIVELAHSRGVAVLVDGAQAAPHLAIDVSQLGCDFYALSGHKMYGPSGIGVLYGKRELLEEMSPFQGGGDMILDVSFERTIFARPPSRFEAGTPNTIGALGLAAAVDLLGRLDRPSLIRYERDLVNYGLAALGKVPGLFIIGASQTRTGVISFVFRDFHPHDIGTILDRQGIAIRTGHHCAQPLLRRLGLGATARASFGCYTSRQEVDALVAGLLKAEEVLS